MNLIEQIEILKANISKKKNYITKHGKNNDANEYDDQWDKYKNELTYDLKKLNHLESFVA